MVKNALKILHNLLTNYKNYKNNNGKKSII